MSFSICLLHPDLLSKVLFSPFCDAVWTPTAQTRWAVTQRLSGPHPEGARVSHGESFTKGGQSVALIPSEEKHRGFSNFKNT